MMADLGNGTVGRSLGCRTSKTSAPPNRNVPRQFPRKIHNRRKAPSPRKPHPEKMRFALNQAPRALVEWGPIRALNVSSR
jgi:hypothetical protein